MTPQVIEAGISIVSSLISGIKSNFAPSEFAIYPLNSSNLSPQLSRRAFTDFKSALLKIVQFGDQMAKAAQKSNTSVEQLGEAILTVGGTAKTLSGGTTELNTLLGIIADNGVKGSEGGTKLLLCLQA